MKPAEFTPSAAVSFLPSADETMDFQPDTPDTLFDSQVTPELVEIHNELVPEVATNFCPSADEAMEPQEPIYEPICGSLFETQVAPELVEV